MTSLEELKEARIRKLDALKKSGLNPYPAKIKRSHEIGQALSNFFLLKFFRRPVALAGRILALRSFGGAAFAEIYDGTGKIQLFLSERRLGKTSYKNFTDNFDVGDFISAEGTLFKTKKNEKTLRVKSLEIIAKALRPLPEKWHGLRDVEERYRKRYLDILMNEKVRANFLIRSRLINELRDFFNKEGFIEVETPELQNLPGGASARPFKTHLNALNLDLYLRVAPELYLKRLLVAGFEKVYEIGRNFRNEGMDASHNPEFTMLEAYLAYENADYLKKLLEHLFTRLIKKINYDGPVDFTPPWQEKTYDNLMKKYGDFDAAKKDLMKPVFVSGFPAETLPLAKASADVKKAGAFQLIAGGLELVKAFTEQNDPITQRERFEEQEKLREKGEEEAQRLDEDFLEALEYGMPPAAGFGLGVDRLAMLLTDSHAAREIILFPTMRPKS